MPSPSRLFCCALFAAVIVLSMALPARAEIIFNFNYADVTGDTDFGFDDPTFGASRRATLDAVAAYINTVVDHTATIDFDFELSQSDGSGSLASAGTFFNIAPGFTNGYLFEHATSGIDPSGSNPDGFGVFDFGYTWNSETDAPTGGEYDLFSVALHEITHSMGFISLVSASGQSVLTGTDPGTYSVFNSFMEKGDGSALFGAGGDFLGVPMDLTNGDVFFDGANATAANGGTPIELYAPGTFSSGSSLGHIDPVTFSDFVMNPAIGAGTQRREYNAIELGILADLGWNVSVVVPSPSAALAGAVLLGLLFVRRITNVL